MVLFTPSPSVYNKSACDVYHHHAKTTNANDKTPTTKHQLLQGQVDARAGLEPDNTASPHLQ